MCKSFSLRPTELWTPRSTTDTSMLFYPKGDGGLGT